jgi:hypothetical protein
MHEVAYNEKMRNVLYLMPQRMRALPITSEGWPQLWFAGITREGVPDLRTADPCKRVLAVKRKLCWLCGQPLGARMVFVLGPMCAVTRTTSEPPCHRDCAEFAAVACPFLSRPKMRRNVVDLPEGYEPPPGTGIHRNPGACALWVCRDYLTFDIKPRSGHESDWLICVGDPEEVAWYAEGRQATRQEILTSIDSGLPLLEAEARRGTDPLAELTALAAAKRRVTERWLPSS